MSRGARARPGLRVFPFKEMQYVRRLQPRGAVCAAILVDQKRKRDSRFVAKQARVVAVSQPHGGEAAAGRSKFPLALAQLRNMLAAEDSAVVAKKHDGGGLLLP